MLLYFDRKKRTFREMHENHSGRIYKKHIDNKYPYIINLADRYRQHKYTVFYRGHFIKNKPFLSTSANIIESYLKHIVYSIYDNHLYCYNLKTDVYRKQKNSITINRVNKIFYKRYYDDYLILQSIYKKLHYYEFSKKSLHFCHELVSTQHNIIVDGNYMTLDWSSRYPYISIEYKDKQISFPKTGELSFGKVIISTLPNTTDVYDNELNSIGKYRHDRNDMSSTPNMFWYEPDKKQNRIENIDKFSIGLINDMTIVDILGGKSLLIPKWINSN